MGKLWAAASFAGAVALSATLVAQSGQTGSTSSQSRAHDEDKTVTLTGCLARADEMGSGSTAGTSGMSRSEENKFVLKNATMGEHSGMGASGTTGSGTTGTTSGSSSGMSSSMGMTYKLEGKESELGSYVGQRVEIKGKLKSSDDVSSTRPGATGSGTTGSGTTGSGTAGSTSGMSSSHHSMANMTVKVDSVRRVSGTCSESGK